LRLLSRANPVKRLMGRVMGLGFRREHIRTADRQGGLADPTPGAAVD
jgi:hypothetical protein